MFKRCISALCVALLIFGVIGCGIGGAFAVSSIYYVDSVNGNDSANGLSQSTAWKSLTKVNSFSFSSGAVVKFACGSEFRGSLVSKSGVTYSNYGTGELPTFIGSVDAYTNGSWSLSSTPNVWVYSAAVSLDVGNIVFNGGEKWGYKQITGVNGFTDETALDSDLEFWHSTSDNKVYLYSTVSPTTRFQSVELCKKQHIISMASNTVYDGLKLLYGGAHGFSGTNISSCIIRNCEIGWIGGSIQSDTVRYGNGIEFWLSCSDITVENNHIYQIYDAGVTHQASGSSTINASMSNVTIQNNTIEYCTYSYEYFLTNSTGTMNSIRFTGNTCRHAGLGFGAQRPDIYHTSHITSWSTQNTATDFVISGNSFEGSTRCLINIDSTAGTLPTLSGNTYKQYEDSTQWENTRSLGFWNGTNYIFGSSAAATLLGSIDPSAVTGRCAYPVDSAAAQTIIDNIFGKLPATSENLIKLYEDDSTRSQVSDLLGFGENDGLCDYLETINCRTSIDFSSLAESLNACVSALELSVPNLSAKGITVTLNDVTGQSTVKYVNGDTYGSGADPLSFDQIYGYASEGWQIDPDTVALQSDFGISANAVHGSSTDTALPDRFSVSVSNAYYLNCTAQDYAPEPAWVHSFTMDNAAAQTGVVLITTQGVTDMSQTGLTLTVAPYGSSYFPRQITAVTTDCPGINVETNGEFICGTSYTDTAAAASPQTLSFSGTVPTEPTLITVNVGVRAYHPTWSYGSDYGVNYLETTVCFKLWLLPAETTVLSGNVSADNTVLPFEHSLTALRTAKSGTVTFNSNGGECSEQSRAFTYGQSLGELPVPSRDGFEFNGWKLSEQLDGSVGVTSNVIYGSSTDSAILNNFDVTLRSVDCVGNSSYTYSPQAAWQSGFTMDAGDAPCAVIAVSPSDYGNFSELPLNIYTEGTGAVYYPRQIFEASTDCEGITVSGCGDYIVGTSPMSASGASTPVTYSLSGSIPNETTEITITLGVRAYHPTWTSDNSYGVFYVESTVKIKLLIIVEDSLTVKSNDLPLLACNHTLSAQWKRAVTAITLSGKTSLTVGERAEFSCTLTPSNADDVTLTWSSSSPGCANVTNYGVVRALSAGYTTITATAPNGVSGSLNISVTPTTPQVRIISASDSFSVKVDWWKKYSSAPLNLMFISYNTGSSSAVWSSDSSSVIVSPSGVVTNTGKYAASANISLTVYNSAGEKIARNTVKVSFYKFRWQKYFI